jgi:hypothetical protein
MTKALHVCRTLHAAGWRVVLVETHKYRHVGARFSNSVDVFTTVPVPELQPQAYKQAIAGEYTSPNSGIMCVLNTVALCDRVWSKKTTVPVPELQPQAYKQAIAGGSHTV